METAASQTRAWRSAPLLWSRYAPRRVETALAGQKADEKIFRDAAALVADAIDPIADFRGSADYKRKMAVVHVRRALAEAATKAKRPA